MSRDESKDRIIYTSVLALFSIIWYSSASPAEAWNHDYNNAGRAECAVAGTLQKTDPRFELTHSQQGDSPVGGGRLRAEIAPIEQPQGAFFDMPSDHVQKKCQEPFDENQNRVNLGVDNKQRDLQENLSFTQAGRGHNDFINGNGPWRLPEPGTIALVGLGLGALGVLGIAMRRRRAD